MGISIKEYQSLLDNQGKLSAKKDNKYHAKAVISDGYRFDSKKEERFFQALKLKQKAGFIKYFLRQIPFHLNAKPSVTYRCDFMVCENDNTVTYWESKGYMTQNARTKIAMTEKLYNVKINVV